jgi:hypothetical protein
MGQGRRVQDGSGCLRDVRFHFELTWCCSQLYLETLEHPASRLRMRCMMVDKCERASFHA